MEFLHDCSLLKIEDILPFFPDFVTIDHFKVFWICSISVSLEHRVRVRVGVYNIWSRFIHELWLRLEYLRCCAVVCHVDLLYMVVHGDWLNLFGHFVGCHLHFASGVQSTHWTTEGGNGRSHRKCEGNSKWNSETSQQVNAVSFNTPHAVVVCCSVSFSCTLSTNRSAHCFTQMQLSLMTTLLGFKFNDFQIFAF